MDRLEAGDEVFAEDREVLGGNPTVYNSTTAEYAVDHAYITKNHLYHRTPIEKDQWEKLSLGSSVNVYDVLQTVHGQLSMDPDQFSIENIKAESLMPPFVFCNSDTTLDDIRLNKRPTEELHEKSKPQKVSNTKSLKKRKQTKSLETKC
jgi:hypothetical protein